MRLSPGCVGAADYRPGLNNASRSHDVNGDTPHAEPCRFRR